MRGRHVVFCLPSRLLLGLLLFSAVTACAQQQGSLPTPTIRLTTQLVSLDVVIIDGRGHPVHDLAAKDFQVFDDGVLQQVRTFDEHLPTPANTALSNQPRLPPNTFTNDEGPTRSGSVGVLLVDALNTPVDDQSYLRSQLLDYLKHAPAGRRIAVFGLNTQLSLLQEFTSNRELLMAALEHKPLGTSPLLSTGAATAGLAAVNPAGITSAQSSTSVGTVAAPVAAADPSANPALLASIYGGVADLEAEQASTQTQFRVRLTLDALNALTRYLAAVPGRKNLLWFSGSFPSVIAPGLQSGTLAGSASLVGELQQTIDLMARSHVAVYPVDPRGVQVSPMFQASASGRHTPQAGAQDSAMDRDFFADRNNEHGTMDTIAQNTGGQAFYNTNDLTAAVSAALDEGASYYTLTYKPSSEARGSVIHRLTVKLPNRPQLILGYRRSYVASYPSTKASAANKLASASSFSNSDLMRRDMALHAIASTELILEVHVIPKNQPVESGGSPADRVLEVEVGVDPHALSFAGLPNGDYSDKLEFVTLAYQPDGKLMQSQVNSISVNLHPAGYQLMLKSGLRYDQLATLPAHGNYILKIGVREIDTDHIGTVEVPGQAISCKP